MEIDKILLDLPGVCLVEYKWIRGEPTGFSWTTLE